jgi:peptidoglycan/xylan/chitin deacetylase (PgdA/CDA1 family)
MVEDVAAVASGRRQAVKRWLSRLPAGRTTTGATFLIYHRVGGGSRDERDIGANSFREQLDVLAEHSVLSIDDALDRVEKGSPEPSIVLTFDDGFRDLYENGWPLLRDRGLPFTVYLTTAYVGDTMHWEGSTAHDTGAAAVTWDQLQEMVDSGLCTVGNHTHTHVRPERLNDDELDRCTQVVQERLGVTPRHFAYTWGVPVAAMETALRARFRSAATGHLGRVRTGSDLARAPRIPVRGSDPVEFFAAKLTGNLLPERAYAGLVGVAKRAGASA